LEHPRVHVHADDRGLRTHEIPGEPGHDAGATGDVEDARARLRRDGRDHRLGEGTEEGTDQFPLVELGEGRLAEGEGHGRPPFATGTGMSKWRTSSRVPRPV